MTEAQADTVINVLVLLAIIVIGGWVSYRAGRYWATVNTEINDIKKKKDEV